MNELYVFCEGATEQGFCSQLLQPHLFPRHDGLVHTIKIAHSRRRGVVRRGGARKYGPIKHDIQNTLNRRKQDGVYFTTMIDLYGLPGDFPGRADHVYTPNAPTPYVEALENAFGEDIGDRRFVPYLQLHEYETLLFADLEAFRVSFDDCDDAIAALTRVANSFPSLEHIDLGENTAPSKRILRVLPEYAGSKATAGPDIAEFIGLPAIRGSCPHFDAWLTRLERILARG